MIKCLLIILFIIFRYNAYNQIFKGTILDKDTKQPIDFAVAYFAGTFTGTNADKNGNFELDISKNKAMPLTISALGYYSVSVTDLSAGKTLKIYLAPKDYELNEVVIRPGNIKKDRRDREKYLRLFRKQFLGETPNAGSCKILNENDITLRFENDTLKAFSSKPILIDNLALGYRITFFLDQFEYASSEMVMYLKGNILFNTDMDLKNSQTDRFERKRRNAYYGSRMHFFRALWENKIDSEGFMVIDSTYTKILIGSIINQGERESDRKYFKYRGKLDIKYGSETRPVSPSILFSKTSIDYAGSRLAILKDSVYFDKNGASVEGIRWYGRMGKQRIADTLPFEYYPNKNRAEDTEEQQNQMVESSLLPNQAYNGNQNLNNSLPGEKVFLHLDRPNYMQGDTIWFKAYSWFGYEQLADTVSKVLYAELLNPKDSIELKKKLLIQNGTSVGEFIVDKSMPPGKYTIRAYTRWMQNENAGEPFYQSVTINALNQNFQVDFSPLIIKQADGDSLRVAFRFYEIDPSGDLKNDFSHQVKYAVRIGEKVMHSGQELSSNTMEQVFKCRLPEIGINDSVAVLSLSIKDERLTYEKQFRIPLKEELDLQFFPEGGNLVNGLESKVAFKAIGRDGLSHEVKGVVKDSTGEVVTSFKSLHKGMGYFLFTPEVKKEYSAFAEYNHRQFKFSLPKAAKEGCVMSVSCQDNENVSWVKVSCSPSKTNVLKYVVGSAYGKIRFASPVNIAADSCLLSIPAELLPEGVSRITVFDSGFKPECERLVYIEKNQRFKIEVNADSSYYGARAKVTLSVKTTLSGEEAVTANLSLAVVDKEQIIKDQGTGGISAYKLLESELKGYIEDAGNYFKDDSVNYQALDLLLLTQGYRRFFAENTKTAEIKFLPGRSFDITGKVALRANNGKDKTFNYSDLGLTLFCPSDKAYYDQTSPDSLGRFSFTLPLQFGNPLSLIKAFTARGKLKKTYLGNASTGTSTYTSTGRLTIPKEKTFRGDIFIDEAVAPIFTAPLPVLTNITVPTIDYIRQLQALKKIEVSKIADSIKWKLTLPEITITGTDKRWYEHFEVEANKIVDMDSLDPTGKKYGNVYDLLIREFGAQRMHDNGVETVIMPTLKGLNYWFPIYLINGETYFNGGEGGPKTVSLLNMLSSLRVSEIKKIMLLPPGNITYHYADPNVLMSIKQSMVVIESYSKKNFYRGDPDGIKTFIIDGLNTPRLFYSPRYEGQNKTNPNFDGRATLYWNPLVRTDQNGEAKVEFYTGDRKTEMEVVVNGIILGKGFTGQVKTSFKTR